MTQLTAASIEQAIDTYGKVRDAVHEIARANNGAALGNYSWLRNAIDESDLEPVIDGDVIRCTGTTWSNQTQDHEYFRFEIPVADVIASLTPITPIGCLDDPEATVMDGICHHPGDRHPIGQPRTPRTPGATDQATQDDAPQTQTPQGVALVWLNDDYGYQCPQCRLFVAIPKRDGAVCPRCEPATAAQVHG